jgi:hypothetical protein
MSDHPSNQLEKHLPDDCFMIERVSALTGKHCQGRIATDKVVEIGVVDMERLGECFV